MADRYWVGGTANWDGTAGTKWSTTSGGAGGASVPTSADAVFFTAASTGTCTISTGNTGALSINCTGHTGTIAGTAAISVAGSVTLVAGQTFTYTGTLTLTATGTLTTGGKSLFNVTIDAPGGTVTLGSALTVISVIQVNRGTFTTSASNYAVTASRLTTNVGSDAKTISLNGSTVSLSSTSSTNPAFTYTGTNLTFNAGTSTINITSGSGHLDGNGGLTFNNVAFTSANAATKGIFGANTFSQLTITSPATGITQFNFGANQTITTFVAAGASAVRRVFLCSDTLGTRRTLTVTTWSTISDIDFRDIGMNSSRSGTRLGDCGNNTNVTFTAAQTVYWNLTGSQNWSSTGWATTSGGTPAANNFPLAQDTVVFDNTGAATTVNIEEAWNIGTLSMGSRTNAMTLSGGSWASVYGDWTTGSGVTLNFSNTIYFAKAGTQTITSAGKSFFIIACFNPLGTISLADALTTTSTSSGVTIVNCTFNANTYSVTTAELSSTSATLNRSTGTWTIFGTGNVWTVIGGTVTGTGEIILSNNTTAARTFGGNSKTYGKLTIGGTNATSTLTITGNNTFSEIASTKTVAHEIIFPNATTTVGAFTVQGSAGNLVTLSRTGASGTFTLAKSGGGIVSSNYLSISNSTASPSNTWYAGANSTDGGGNTGWIFTNAPTGNFIAFFM